MNERHHRQRLLPFVGDHGQEALAAAHVLVAGCGALGSFVIDQLARAGVGELTLVDRDVVEATNLQRQTLFVDEDARRGVPKAEAAARRVRAIDPALRVHGVVEHLDAANALELLRGVDLVVDGLDNFPTRYLLNDACVRQGLPFVYGGAVGTTGLSMTVLPHEQARASDARPSRVRWAESSATPCLACLFPEAPPPGSTPTCDTAGVLAGAVATVASHQAMQAIKLLVGALEIVDRSLVSFDFARNRVHRLAIDQARRADCRACVHGRFEYLVVDEAGQAVTLCGRNAVQIVPRRHAQAAIAVDLAALAMRLREHGSFEERDGVLRGRIDTLANEDGEPIELSIFRDGRAIVHGSPEPDFARSIYDRFIGA